jgi:intein-encoded DNA endonuclease-like protein
LKLWNWIDIMKAWIIYTDVRQRSFAKYQVEAVVTIASNYDLKCSVCPPKDYCPHMKLALKTNRGYDSPFVEEIEVENQAQALEEEFLRRFLEHRRSLISSTHFIEL